MTLQPDANDVDLRIPLQKLFAAVETRLDDVRREVREPAEPDVVLDVLDKVLKAPLMAEAELAGGANMAAWHLARLAMMVMGEAGVPASGPGSGPYRSFNAARQQLDGALTAVSERHEQDIATRLSELEHLVQQQPQEVASVVEAALAKQGCPCAAELGKLEGDIQGLPDAISTTLITDIPQIVSGVITMVKGLSNGAQQQPPPPVIKPVPFEELEDLAAASAGKFTHSPDDQINFLAGALQVLQEKGPVPAALRGPIVTVIASVLYFHDPTAPPLTGPQLNDITDLKQQITPFLL